MPTIKCTNCGAGLKTAQEIPPGKKVKCPKCNQPFVVQAEDEEKPADEPAGGDDNAFSGMGGGEGDANKGKGEKKKSNTMLFVIIGLVVVFFCCLCPIIGFVLNIVFGAGGAMFK